MKRTALIIALIFASCYIAARKNAPDTTRNTNAAAGVTRAASAVTQTASAVTQTASAVTQTALAVTQTAVPVNAPFGALYASATTVCAKAKITDWQTISPININAKWYLRIVHKDNPGEIKEALGIIDSKTTVDSRDYFYFYVPEENKGNVVRFDANGAYIKNLKFPVFGFIFLDVVLDPEINYIRFPMKEGDTWVSKSTGTVTLLNFIKITRDTSSKFTVLSEVDATLDGRKVHAFRVACEIDKGEGKTEKEEVWYGVGVGMMYQDTEAYTLELVRFDPGTDTQKDAGANTNTETDSSPGQVSSTAKI